MSQSVHILLAVGLHAESEIQSEIANDVLISSKKGTLITLKSP